MGVFCKVQSTTLSSQTLDVVGVKRIQIYLVLAPGLTWDIPDELVPEGTFHHLLDFLVQNEDSSGRHTGWTATPSGLIGAPTSAISTIFMLDAIPGTTLPIYLGLGQTPNMLACIPGDLE